MTAAEENAGAAVLAIWREALADRSGAQFGMVVTPRVRLEGAVFATPIDGREKVWTCLRAAGGITEKLTFTHQSAAADRTYLEWELEALGQRFDGVTVLTLNGSGLIENIALHHRPLGAVLAISAELGRRLGNSVGPEVFYQADALN